MTELAGERLVLRPARLQDLDFYVELRNHPAVLASGPRGAKPRADVERTLRRWIEERRTRGLGAWTVFDRLTGEPLGRVELDPVGPGWDGIGPDEVEVGCIVHPDRWSRGIATEATALALADFFARFDAARVVALTAAANAPSLRALEKLGMRRCGTTRHETGETAYELFELERPPGH